MKRTLRLRPLLKRLLQIAGILIIAQSIVDYRRSRAAPQTTTSPPTNNPPANRDQKVFIASIHWNNEKILRSHWIPALLDLVAHLGESNVFVSVQESGSWDDSKGALRELDAALGAKGVRRRIVLDETTHADELGKTPAGDGWIQTSRSGETKELRRVPYLAKLRNLVLEPLEELAREEGKVFERVVWLNDVVFTTQDVQRLLDTRGGDYAAACSLDFSKPPAFYDTFALRDSDGHAAIMQSWPYLRSKASRDALKASEPVPVTSCWNGMVAMAAAPFYTTPNSTPLRFRGIPDSLAARHLEGSECCLIHTDNPLSAQQGVWLNPNVRVGYDSHAYDVVNPRDDDDDGSRAANAWVGTASVLHGSWENRVLRWLTTTWFEDATVGRRVGKWRAGGGGREESGVACLVNEMQVLVANGWAHV